MPSAACARLTIKIRLTLETTTKQLIFLFCGVIIDRTPDFPATCQGTGKAHLDVSTSAILQAK
jgi:hypothetical protein